MKKGLKIIGFLLLAVVALAVIAILVMSEKEPQGQTGPAADELAQKMVAAVNGEAWDSTRWIRWNFADRHEYIWDKERNFVQVDWDENTVLLHTKSVEGLAYCEGEEQQNGDREELVSKAWEYFCNDSYWLNPVVKAFDPGTERSLVEVDDGRSGLKVSYTSGGVTPGDAYVWILDESHRPVAWKMWVDIIPIGGLENSWEGWQQLPSGAWISTTHEFFGQKAEMIKAVQAGTTAADLGLAEDPFAPLAAAGIAD